MSKQEDSNRRVLSGVIYALGANNKRFRMEDVRRMYYKRLRDDCVTDPSLGEWMRISDFVDRMMETRELSCRGPEYYLATS